MGKCHWSLSDCWWQFDPHPKFSKIHHHCQSPLKVGVLLPLNQAHNWSYPVYFGDPNTAQSQFFALHSHDKLFLGFELHPLQPHLTTVCPTNLNFHPPLRTEQEKENNRTVSDADSFTNYWSCKFWNVFLALKHPKTSPPVISKWTYTSPLHYAWARFSCIDIPWIAFRKFTGLLFDNKHILSKADIDKSCEMIWSITFSTLDKKMDLRELWLRTLLGRVCLFSRAVYPSHTAVVIVIAVVPDLDSTRPDLLTQPKSTSRSIKPCHVITWCGAASTLISALVLVEANLFTSENYTTLGCGFTHVTVWTRNLTHVFLKCRKRQAVVMWSIHAKQCKMLTRKNISFVTTQTTLELRFKVCLQSVQSLLRVLASRRRENKTCSKTWSECKSTSVIGQCSRKAPTSVHFCSTCTWS